MLALLLDYTDKEPHWRAPPSLRAVILGGAAATPELLARARERGLHCLPSYGMTETCAQICTAPYRGASRGVGKPLAGVELRIGEDGCVEVRGPMLMDGYLAPARRGIDNQGWFRTNDRGHIDGDGFLHIAGRSDDLIISGGENIDPIAVKRTLEKHPKIRAAQVFGIADKTWGQVVCAVVESDSVDPSAVRSFARQHLARYEQPRRILVVDRLPLGETGKIDRQMLAKLVSRD